MPKDEDINLDIYDKAILKTIHSTPLRLNTNQIANNVEIQWKTAKEHLESLEERGLVKSKKDGRATLWIPTVDIEFE